MFAVFVYVLAFVLGGNGSTALTEDESKIVEAKVAHYSYQVSIELNCTHSCGATIIDDVWVLTSQSCIKNTSESTVKVRTGTHRLSYHGSLHSVTKAVNYTHSTMFERDPTDEADLGMYKVSTRFRYKPSINRLNIAEQAPSEGDTGFISGWGRASKEKGSVLEFTKVEVMAKSDCENATMGLVNITSGMSCVRSVEDVSKNCIADVGGPLLNNYQLAGVVSYSPQCKGSSTKPVVVTNVGTYSSSVLTVLCGIISRS